MSDKLDASLEQKSMRNMILREAHSQKKVKVRYIFLVLCTKYTSFSSQLEAHHDNWNINV